MIPPSSAAQLDPRWRAALRGCERVLCHVRLETVWERLDRLVQEADAVVDHDTPMDVYGDGVVRDLERRVADTLGKPKALFFASGIMAQHAAVRVHADRSGKDAVALHPLAHAAVREMNALSAVVGLQTLFLGERDRCLTADDVRGAPGDFSVLMLELPLRDAGFILPDWDELRATVASARERGVAVHFDGARLWECTPRFGRTLPEIAVWGVHPASVVLVLAYVAGVRLSQSARTDPMWHPEPTRDTHEDTPDEDDAQAAKDGGARGPVTAFLLLVALMATAGWVLSQAASVLTDRYGLSASLVGALLTAVLTSLPELVTTLAAVRRNALQLAVGGIIGGNTFDTLFLTMSDVAYRDGSLYTPSAPRTGSGRSPAF